MKVLLVVLDKNSHINFFSLGIAYIASVLRSRGYNEIDIFNQEVYHYPDEEIIKVIEDGSYDVIGLGFYGYQQYRKATNFLTLPK